MVPRALPTAVGVFTLGVVVVEVGVLGGVALLARDLAREEVRGVLAEEEEELGEAGGEVERGGEDADGGAELAGGVDEVAELRAREGGREKVRISWKRRMGGGKAQTDLFVEVVDPPVNCWVRMQIRTNERK